MRLFDFLNKNNKTIRNQVQDEVFGELEYEKSYGYYGCKW